MFHCFSTWSLKIYKKSHLMSFSSVINVISVKQGFLQPIWKGNSIWHYSMDVVICLCTFWPICLWQKRNGLEGQDTFFIGSPWFTRFICTFSRKAIWKISSNRSVISHYTNNIPRCLIRFLWVNTGLYQSFFLTCYSLFINVFARFKTFPP